MSSAEPSSFPLGCYIIPDCTAQVQFAWKGVHGVLLKRDRAHVPGREGGLSWSCPHPRRGQMGSGKGDFRYQRLHARRRLVRAAAGSLQAHSQRQGRHHRGGAGRDHRLFGHDTFRRHGKRDSSRQDAARGTQHRSRLRCHQHRDARALPANRLWSHADGVLRRRPSHWGRSR